MSYRWVDHTAEVELEIEVAGEEEVFADALEALAELLFGQPGGETVEREVAVSGDDRAGLLAEWLNELVFLAETEDLVPQSVRRLELSQTGVRAAVRFRRSNPRHLVKGATYHRLAFDRSAGGYQARVVLDV